MNEGINIVIEGLGSFNLNPGQIWASISNPKTFLIAYPIVAFVYASIMQHILFRRFKNVYKNSQIDPVSSLVHFILQFLIGVPSLLILAVALVICTIMYPIFTMIIGNKYSLRGWLFETVTVSEDCLRNHDYDWVKR